MSREVKNTDRELWRERDDYYADSIHVTEGGGIGINCGGTVIVKPLREWHKLALFAVAGPTPENFGLIPLNEQQLNAAKVWAMDDRYWTTQEVVEVNLR